MIIIKLSGGLGNQLFQYAFAKRLSAERNVIVKFDTSFFNKNQSRSFELSGIQDIKIASKGEIIQCLHLKFPYAILVYLLPHIPKFILNKSKYYIEEKYPHMYDSNILSKSEGYFDGYWQCYKYVQKNITSIKEVLLASKNMKKDDSKVIDLVAIHIRAGDYLNIPNVKGICSRDYYTEALNIIKRTEPNAKFNIFCEDIDYAKKILPEKNDYNFVETNFKDPLLDLLHISTYKYIVIANSTFSLWAAFLNNHANIVIAPKNWNNTVNEISNKLYPDYFLKI